MSNATDKQRRALGKGLSALLPTKPQPQNPHSSALATAVAPASALLPTRLRIDEVEPNPLQPRVVFQPERLDELAASIRANGIIQPIIVRKIPTGYQLVAGERRWRAAQLAGLTEVPVVVQEISDPQLLEIALVENIQREDLNPIETAQAYDRLARQLGLSQEEIAQRTGKDRSSIANTLRLLKLPKEVQILLAEHRLAMGHARAVLGLHTAEQQIEVAEKASAQGLSVRQVEALVQELTSDRPKTGSGHKREQPQDPNVRAAIEELERALGTRVRIIELSEQRGRIEIEYYSQVELERLYQHITASSR
jgi:ParB family chromosome partitioning protein